MSQNLPPLTRGQQPWPLWLRAVLFSVAYFLCAEAGSYLSARGTTYVSFWMPAGLYVAVLLLNERRDWLWLVLAALPANVAFDLLSRDTPWLLILCFYSANTIQSVLGAWLVQRFVAIRPTLATLKEFIGLLGFSAVLSTAVGATIGAGTLVAFRFSTSFFQSWQVWWGSTAMAILILAPFILTWCAKSDATPMKLGQPKRWFEAAALLLVTAVLTWQLLFVGQGIESPNKGPMVLPVLWAGLRFGPRGAATVNLLLALVLTFGTTQLSAGLTPEQIASGEYTVLLQMSLAVMALVGMIPAAVVNERDQAMTKLGESEARYRHLTEAAFEGIAISERGRVLDVNDQCLRMFGYERGDMIGREIVEMVAPDSRAIVAEAIRTGQESIYEHRLLRKDGSSFYGEARARVVRTGGRTLRMTAMRDITERKRAEEALQLSEEKFSKAFQASPSSMLITRAADGRILEANEAFASRYGMSCVEARGKTVFELGIWQNQAERDAILAKLSAGGAIRGLEKSTVLPSGQRSTVLLAVETLVLKDEPCLLTVSHDVTELKAAEQALRRSEELFRAVVQDQTEMIVRWKPDGTRTFVNQAYCRVFGGQPEDYVGSSFYPLISEGDRETVRAKVRSLTPTQPVATAVHRSLTPAGGPCWQEWTDRGVFDAAGRLVELQSTGRDITERMQAEEALRQSEEKFAKAFRSSPDAIAISDLETGQYIEVNEGHRRLFGYQREEVIGKTSMELGYWQNPDDRVRMVETLRATGSVRDLELRGRNRQGDGITVLINAEIIELGGRSCIASTVHDITEQRKAEASLREAQARELKAREAFARQLLTAQERERQRLAAELHDSLGQNLSLIKNRARLVQEAGALPEPSARHLEAITRLVGDAISEVRGLVHNLRPIHIEHIGLTDMLEALILEVVEASGIQIEHRLEKVDDLFKEEEATSVFRILQESLNNLVKHSGARQARVALERDIHCVRLAVSDSGRGFEPGGIVGRGGLGLTSLAERARMLGGTFQITSAPGQGTTVTVELPIAEDGGI